MSIAENIRAISEYQSRMGISQTRRYTIFPIQDELSYNYYLLQEATHWTEQELDFTTDYRDYLTATDAEKRMVNGVIAFFLVGEGAISYNLVRFLMEVCTYEEQAMFVSQLHIELIHAMTYNRIASSLIRDDNDFQTFIDRTEQSEAVQSKLEFMNAWTLGDHPRWQRLIAFACAEGLFFIPLFPIILYFRASGRFSNFIAANELIRSDETLHCHYGCDLAMRELTALSGNLTSSQLASFQQENRETILSIVTEAVRISCLYHDYILPTEVEGLSNEGLKIFTKVMANNILARLGCDKYFDVTNIITFMEDASLEMKSNFYERKAVNYTKPLTKAYKLPERPSVDYSTLHDTQF